ncbi:MAG: hypothetical protein J5758_02090 [Abditibacteriota bacterium]|nr:hypothetical protein [Abditibacteriota bacterium]
MLLPVNHLVDADGEDVTRPVVLDNAVINLIMPKTEFYCSNPDHDPSASRSFPRGDNYSEDGLEMAINECPSCHTSKFVSVVPKTPIEKGDLVVRYFLGLKFNKDEDANKSIMTPGDLLEDPLDWTVEADEGWKPQSGWNDASGIDNSLILYRVEFDPYDNSLFPEEYYLPEDRDADPGRWDKIMQRRISDPNVFYHPDVAEVWAERADTVGLAASMDLAAADKDKDYVGGYPFRVKSTVAFVPAAIAGEAPRADTGNEAAFDAQGFAPASYSTKYALLGKTLRVEVTRSDANMQPVKKWLLEVAPNGSNGVLREYASPSDPTGAQTDIFDVNDYMYGASRCVPQADMQGEDMPMAFTFNAESGKIEFGLVPKPNPELQDNLDQTRLFYYPDIDVYGYKFLEYANASVVPGSESVSYYNAYYKNSTGDIVENGYVTYNDLEAHGVDSVYYQRAPYSLGQLTYNQYKMDYEKGIVYWKPLLTHSANVFPELYIDIPTVNYRIQFNKPSDKVTISYSTNEVIDVVMDMRMHYSNSFPPKSSSVNEKVVVGNALR